MITLPQTTHVQVVVVDSSATIPPSAVSPENGFPPAFPTADFSCIGHVIRQERAKDEDGEFLPHKRPVSRASKHRMTSAFEDGKPYELTDIGRHFVHFTMTELVPKLGDNDGVNYGRQD